MTDLPETFSLEALLETSQAAPEFKEAARELARGARQDRIEFNRGAPPIKILRVLKKLLETHPGLPIERVRIEGDSGCSNFIGRAVVQPGALAIDFDWDCRWQAGQLGWRDPYGDPDQVRAARQLDYQCFRKFEPAAARATREHD